MNEIINSSTLRQGAAPWNTEIVSFNQNVKLDLWGQSANDIVKIRRVSVQEGAIINTTNQICCITPATKAQVKASKLVLRCDCDGSRPAELTTDVSSIILSAGAYVFEYSGSGFAAKTTVLAYEKSDKDACDCACAQAPCLPVSVTTASTGMTSATVTIVSGSDAYGREVTVKLFNGANEYEQVGVNGDVLTFTGLSPETTYSVVATNDCGKKDSKQVTTAECPPCPEVAITATAVGTNSVQVAVTSAEPAWVELNGVKRYIAGGQSTIFTGLDPSTEYFLTATNDCGSMATASAKTLPCPAISLTQTTNTTNSITVTLVTGGSASVFVGSDEIILANGGTHTFTGLTAGKTYTAKVVSACGNKASLPITTADCPAVDFTSLALSTTSLQVTAVAGTPLDVSIVSQGGAVLDAIDGLTSTIVFTDLPDGAIVTVKAVNECGKKKQLNVKLPATPMVVSPCPSFSLSDASPAFKGFAYVPGDLVDPAATVPFRGGFIYPTAGVGHTVKVTDALGTVIGYAANKSDCANPCCDPIVNLKKCGGTALNTETDEILVKGSLLACDNTPLPCNAKLRQCCDQTVFVRAAANMQVGAGVCLYVSPTEWTYIGSTGNTFIAPNLIAAQAIDPSVKSGRAVVRMRDLQTLEGDIVLDPSAVGAYHAFTYTNPHSCNVLLEVDLYVSDNYSTGVYTGNEAITMIHKVSETLAEPLPQVFNTQVDRSIITNTVSDSGVNVGNPVTPFVGAYSAQTAYGGQYQKMLAPGQTVTLYAQSWLLLYEHKKSATGGFVVHANKSFGDRVTIGGVLV